MPNRNIQELSILIFPTTEGKWQFDIMNIIPDFTSDEPIDGGICTTTMLNALEMAYQQARELIIHKANK